MQRCRGEEQSTRNLGRERPCRGSNSFHTSGRGRELEWAGGEAGLRLKGVEEQLGCGEDAEGQGGHAERPHRATAVICVVGTVRTVGPWICLRAVRIS